MLNLKSVYFGQAHKDFDYRDYEMLKKVERLARKHQRQAENDCNGEGQVNGKFYRCDGSTEGAYLADKETTIFNAEMDKIEDKINRIIDALNLEKYALWVVKPWTVKYQGDPRGYTVKLSYDGDAIEWQYNQCLCPLVYFQGVIR